MYRLSAIIYVDLDESFYNPKKVLESPFPDNILYDKKMQCQIIIISMCLL